jgi:hypothetical protein
VPVHPVERKLAAILAADVAGYSRLMGQDEAGTLARLREHRRELIDPKIADHKGRIRRASDRRASARDHARHNRRRHSPAELRAPGAIPLGSAPGGR